MTTQIPDPAMYSAVGPRAFPFIIGGAMLVSGIWLWLSARRDAGVHSRASGEVTAEGQSEMDAGKSQTSPLWPIALLTALMAAYLLFFDRLGFILSTALLIFGTCLVLRTRSVARDGIISVLAGITFYYLFANLLGVRLPQGVFGF